MDRCRFVCFTFVLAVVGCGPGKATGDGSASDSDGETVSGSGATDTDGGSDYGDCDDYLECVAAIDPGMYPATEMAFGPESACWRTDPQVREGCLSACTAGLEAFAEAFPDEAKCGGTGSESTGGPEPTTGGPEPTTDGGINGHFLLAVSTTVDRGLPLQFIARNEVTEVNGAQQVSICLQSLSLKQGSVLQPREPVGDPLCFADLPIVNDEFVLDIGILHLDGLANPITSAAIVANLILEAEIEGEDFYCGRVTGDFTDPPVGAIDGSTFAAVRLDDVKVLPDPVIIDCQGTSVTDN